VNQANTGTWKSCKFQLFISCKFCVIFTQILHYYYITSLSIKKLSYKNSKTKIFDQRLQLQVDYFIFKI
jgi:hypothetical protein